MKTILLIEDNKDVRENTTEILELANYKVFAAENGKKGIEVALREYPDLIICDIMMPVLDGYGVLHALSKNKEAADIPFIFLTAKAERGEMRRGMEMGADDYITKPFEDVELLNAVETRLKKTDSLRKNFASSIEGLNEFLDTARKVENVKLISDEREIRPYRKRQLIYQEGRHPLSLFFIHKGKVKIFRQNNDGKELITHILKEGDFFGYTALLEDKAYDDSAEALEDAEIMLVPKSDFNLLIHSDGQIAGKFISMLAQNLSEMEQQLLQLAYNSVRKRVADGLLHVYDQYRKSPADQPAIRITREDLAQVVGTATESLIRTLSDFKSEKLIDISEGRISILNEQKLRSLLN